MRNNRLIILCVAVLLLGLAGGGFYALRKYQMYERVQAYRPIGLAAVESGDHDQGVGMLGAYLQHYPDDVEALYHYAQARQQVELPRGAHLGQAIGTGSVLGGCQHRGAAAGLDGFDDARIIGGNHDLLRSGRHRPVRP